MRIYTIGSRFRRRLGLCLKAGISLAVPVVVLVVVAVACLYGALPAGAQRSSGVIIVQQWAELPSERLLRDPNELFVGVDSNRNANRATAPILDKNSDPFPDELPGFSELLGLENENERLLRYTLIKSETQPMSAEIVSAIIYGYNFDFVPSSTTRAIEEVWELTPIVQIDPESRQFTLLSAMRDERLLYTVFRFDVPQEQQRILDSWNNATVLSGFGQGQAVFVKDGITTKRAAISEAIKEAVYLRLRQQYPNAPRRVRGRTRLETPPLFTIIDRRYSTKVDIEIKIDSVEAHTLF